MKARTVPRKTGEDQAICCRLSAAPSFPTIATTDAGR